MGDINFIPEEGRKNTRSKRNSKRGALQYTSGAVEAVQEAQRTESPKTSPISETTLPKKKHSFFHWRMKKKKKQTAQAIPTMLSEKVADTKEHTKVAPPPPQLPQAHNAIHNAPKHVKEEVELNLLDTLQQFSAQPKPQPSLKPAPKPTPVQTPRPTPSVSRKQPPVQPAAQSAPAQKRETPRKKNILPPPPPFSSEKEGPVMNLGVNLIPRVLNGNGHVHHPRRTLILVAVASLVLILLAYAGLQTYKQRYIQQAQQTEQEIAQLDKQIAEYTQLKQSAQQLSAQLDAVEEVLNAHVFWTPFFTVLEDMTLPTVYYRSMTGSAMDGAFSFESVAKNFEHMEAQIQLFRQSEYVESVVTTSATQQTPTGTEADPQGESASSSAIPDSTSGDQKVTFSMTVQFSPDIFHTVTPATITHQ